MAPDSNPPRIETGYEYEDVKLVQGATPYSSRSDPDLQTRFSRRAVLKRPFVSAAMDTVTESGMAIAMAQEGGIGVIHRFLSVADQAREVARVKRAANFIIENPQVVTPEQTVADARALLDAHGISSSVVVNDVKHRHVVGILTRRDLADEDAMQLILRLMNAGGKHPLITAPCGTDIATAAKILHEHRIEKLPLVNKNGKLCGLITEKDIEQITKYPFATRDRFGRLVVAAAVGIRRDAFEDYQERASELTAAGADVLVIDVAHGGLPAVEEALRHLCRTYPDIDIVAGNVMTVELTEKLVAAGAAGVKVGIAPGYACRTSDVTGVGGGQLTSVIACARAAKSFDVPICADGGIRKFGDIGKALAAGASTVMMGALFAGTEESPGQSLIGLDHRRYKLYRGMSSFGANITLREVEGRDIHEAAMRVTPEGEHLLVPESGSVRDLLRQMEGALRSTMSYIGARTISEMVEYARWQAKA